MSLSFMTIAKYISNKPPVALNHISDLRYKEKMWWFLKVWGAIAFISSFNIQRNVENILDISLSYSLEVQCNKTEGK